MVYSTRRFVVYVFPCVILFLCFSVLLVLRLPRVGKRELILVLFVRLFDLCLFGFVGFLFLLGFGKGCGLRLWHSLDFSLTLFFFFFFFFFFFANSKYAFNVLVVCMTKFVLPGSSWQQIPPCLCESYFSCIFLIEAVSFTHVTFNILSYPRERVLAANYFLWYIPVDTILKSSFEV